MKKCGSMSCVRKVAEDAEVAIEVHDVPTSFVCGFSSEGTDEVVLANDGRVPAEEAVVDAAEASASLEPLPLSIVDGFYRKV